MMISFIRTMILYLLVIFSMRIMGKRQIGEMQASEFVVTLMISNIATIPMEETGISVFYAAVPIFTLMVIEVLLSFVMLKNEKIRHLVSGRPVIIVENGNLDQKALKETRLTIDDFLEELRKNGIFDINSVRFAIIETDGTLSVLQKAEESAVTPKQANLSVRDEAIPFSVIRDGKLSESSIKLCGKTEAWVKKQLKSRNLLIENIFLMTCDKKGKITVIEREM